MRVGLFIPIYFREDAVKACLNSLSKSDFGGIDVFLCVGINGATEEFKKKYLKKYVKTHNGKIFSSIHVFDGNKNFGKPYLINLMSSKYGDFNYIVTIDSDMVCLDDKWLKKFLYSFDYYRGDYELGALTANQTGNNCHFVQKLKNCKKIEISKGLTLVYNDDRTGVAGGVLMARKGIWDMFGGYRAHNIYGSDDGFFALDCKKNGKIMGYIEEIEFFHPFSDNEDYSQWKLRAAKNELLPGEEQGFYENMRKDNGNS